MNDFDEDYNDNAYLECDTCGEINAANKMYGLQCWECSQG